jgi:archaellin
MNKCNVYKNLDEYIKTTFPNVYQANIYSNEISFGSIIKQNSDDFMTKISNILKSGEKSSSTIRNNKPNHTKVVCSG